MTRLLLILTLLTSTTAYADFRTFSVRALASAGLRADATRLVHLTVSVVASDSDLACSVFLSAEESPTSETPPNSDVRTTIDSRYDMVTLSTVDLGSCGEVILLSYESGTRVRFAIYGVGEKATPITLLSGTTDAIPFAIRLSQEGPVICATNHETGNFSRYYLTLYGVRGGALKAVKAFEADKETAFELRRFVREISPETINDFNMPNKALLPTSTAVTPPAAQEPRRP